METQIFVIADDHPMVRAALRESLRCEFPAAELRECASFDELSTLLTQESDIALLLLDLNMPGMQDFVGLLTVRVGWPTVPTVIVSASQDLATIQKSYACGASGFIPKSASMTAIAAGVRRVLAGELHFPQGYDRDSGDDAFEAAHRLGSLTAQQMRVLQLVVEGKLNKQIAGELDIAEQTVKGHVSAILRKLGVMSRTQIVLAVGSLLRRETVLSPDA